MPVLNTSVYRHVYHKCLFTPMENQGNSSPDWLSALHKESELSGVWQKESVVSQPKLIQ